MTRDQELALLYALGMLEGMSGSIHEDAEHYQDLAKFLAVHLRKAFPELKAAQLH